MKKVFVFLSVCLLALTGFLFACNEDRYANLNIYVGSVYSTTSGNRIEKKTTIVDGKNFEYYEVLYGEIFSIEGVVNNSVDMSKTLIFDSINDSIYKSPTQTETSSGSTAMFRANMPSYDEYFKVKISSVETPRNAIYVNFKVVLPVQEIQLNKNMAVTSNCEIDLYDNLTYVSSQPDSGFMTTQKGVNFTIKSFSYEGNTIDYTSLSNSNLVATQGQSKIYSLISNDVKVEIFKLTNGIIEVLSNSFTGTITLQAVSTEFNEDMHNMYLLKLKNESELSEQEILEIENSQYKDCSLTELENNEKLFKEVEIFVVKGLSFSDFSFVGGQTGYTPSSYKAKLNASLYINSLEDYLVNGTNYSYLYEQINFVLNSNAKVSVETREIDESGNDLNTASGIITTDVSSNYSYSELLSRFTYNGTIKFTATGRTGDAYYDLVFTYPEFSNKPTFRFSNLFNEFLNSIDDSVENPNIKAFKSVLCFDTSALPSDIVIYENDSYINFNNISVQPQISIYDNYESSFNFGYGTKISYNLTLAQNVISSRIKDENKNIKIVLTAEDSNLDISQFIEIRDFAGNLITLKKENNSYYFKKDLLNSSANYFYLKATGQGFSEFTIAFENSISSTIESFDGGEIVQNEKLSKQLILKTVKGINNIGVYALSNNGTFEEVDTAHLTENELYQTVVVKLFSSEPSFNQGTLLGIVVNNNTSDNLTITPQNGDIVKVFDLESSYKNAFNALSLEDENVLLRVISVTGLKLGETTLNFVANNGFTVKVKVKVVNALLDDLSKSFNLSVDQNYGRNVVTQSSLNNTSLISGNDLDITKVNSEAKISVKVRGSFSLNYNLNPNATSLINVKYTVKNSSNEVKNEEVRINKNTGVITPNTVGTYYVFVEFSFYTFTTLNDASFLVWGKQTIIKAFILEVYEPATSIKLDKYVINVYDYNSLGYEFKEYAVVGLNVIISPVNASILQDSNVVKFSLDSNSNLTGSNGIYTARLKNNQTSATEYIYVTVYEYGTEYTLVCTVNIFKPNQVEEIGLSIFDNGNEKENKEFSKDDSTIYVSTKNGRTLTINTTINPNSNSVFVNDLVANIYMANTDATINMNNPQTFEEDNSMASLNYRWLLNKQSVVLNNGLDSFNVVINNSLSGYFYVVIFARDSMTSQNAGKVYKKILFQITDGTQENPYEVNNISDLIEIENDPTKHYVLGADINLSSFSNFTPIAKNGFTGSLNGYNANVKGNTKRGGKFFTISGLKITELGNTFDQTTNSINLGLFAKLTSRQEDSMEYFGAIINLTLNVELINLVEKEVSNSNVESVNIGSLVGFNDGGLIMNCAVTCNNYNVKISNKNVKAGGVVGVNQEGYIYNFPNGTDGNNPLSALSTSSYKLSYNFIDNINGLDNSIKDVYSSGKILERNNIDAGFISTNPVNVTIHVSDSETYPISVGGLVGEMRGGSINGIYGTYDYIDKQNSLGVSYLTTYQSQGFDVDVKINSDVNSSSSFGQIVNSNSNIGGVVGSLNCETQSDLTSLSGSIYNVSACGKIGNSILTTIDGNEVVNTYGAGGNVGGIVGIIKNNNSNTAQVKNVLASVKLRGYGNVGGAIGKSNNANMELVRVENYEEENNSNAQTALIIVENNTSVSNAGGIVGSSVSSNISLVYSDSFVYNFNTNYIKYGDIYSSSNNVLGGVVGLSELDDIGECFSTFNIIGKQSTVGGIVASTVGNNEVSVSNVYYIGVLKGTNLSSLTAENKNPFGENVTPNSYYYYYLLDYVDTNSEEEEGYGVLDSLQKVKIYSGDSNLAQSDTWNTQENVYSFSYLNNTNQLQEVSIKVLVYSLNVNGVQKSFNFIKSIPSKISVTANSANIDSFNENNSVNFTNRKFFTSFVDDNENLCIVAKLSNLTNNTFSLNNLFKIVPNPNIVGKLNIVISYSQNNNSTNLISISSKGELILNGLTGNNPITLKLFVRENIYACNYVYLYIVENFDEVLLSNSPSFNENLFNCNQSNPYQVRKNTQTNVFEVLGEYVNEQKVLNNVVYNLNEEGNALVSISNLSNYQFNYEIEKLEKGIYHVASSEDYVKNGFSLIFKNEGTYRVKVSVCFVLNGTEFKITSEKWILYYTVFSGATAVSFNTNEIWLESNETYKDLIFTLKTDASLITDEANNIYPPSLCVVVKDENNKEVYQSFDNNIYTVKYLKLQISNVTYQDNSYYYMLTITVNEENKNLIKKPIYYNLYIYDNGNVFKENPASVQITIVPQGLRGISAVHYRYTQNISKLVNTVNTEEQEEGTNYAYNFTNEPKNTVVAGNEGLFVIDLYPYYSNITSVSIESSLGSLNGNALQFVQLVRVKDSSASSGYSYIYAPTGMSTGNGGIYLNLCSDAVDGEGNIVGLSNLSAIRSYAFLPLEDGSEMGRLYVKTIAPTNIKEEESFVITIKVKFIALNEENEYVEQEFTYEHVLIVESVSGYDLKIHHNNTNRNIIAVSDNVYVDTSSGADWLDLDLTIDETFTSGKINATYISKTNIKRESSDYVNLFPLNNAGKYRLYLGEKAEVGAKIKIDVVLEVEYDGYVEKRTYTRFINVVDLVIESVDIFGAYQDILTITVSTSKQLKVIINGFGTESSIQEAEYRISRMINSSYNSIYYWYANVNNSNSYYVQLDNADIKNSLPFNINKVSVSNEEVDLVINNESVSKTLQKIVVLEGSTSSGSVDMLLNFSYIYYDNENFVGTTEDIGKIAFVPNGFDGAISIERYFTVLVREDSNEDNPTPIYTVDDLIRMGSSTAGDYILMNDLEIDNHVALNARFNSFDGNNKIITINSFSYSTNLASSNNNYSINMGLFNTVESGTIIKNVIVALPLRQSNSSMNLTNYSTINFGAIAAVNSGIITNCDVISIYKNSSFTLKDLKPTDDVVKYAINIETTDVINQTSVTANIGLFVGVNNTSGVITNSRVGREEVEILEVYDSQATVVYKSLYSKTSPIMLVKVYGKADVGGFVANNFGIISSSFAKNLQIENISKSAKSFVKTAGFVVNNQGYIYGSYASGWEEEDMEILLEEVNVSENRKLGGGLFSNGSIGGFVYINSSYIEDCYSNINCSGDLTFTAKSYYVSTLIKDGNNNWSAPAVAGFAYITKQNSYITTSYSLSKIELTSNPTRPNTFGAFEGRMESPDADFDNSGEIKNCYFMLEKTESFAYDHERAIKLTDDPAIDLEEDEGVIGVNEFINKSSFNNFSFDNSFDSVNGFDKYNNISAGGVWAIYSKNGINGYPDLISANTIAISCRVINVTKTNASETNTYYYTYADGYEIGSYLNPYIVSNFNQYNNLFKDVIGNQTFNDEVTTKFTGNIRLVNNINFENSEDVYSTSVEYTSNIDITSIFDGNYLSMYNVTLSDKSNGRSSFGLFKDIYFASVKNLTIVIDSVSAGNTTSVGALSGAIINSNISNITLAASRDGAGTVIGNNYVGGLAGIIVSNKNENLYSIANIKSNLSVIGSISTTENTNSITTSNVIWERIKPISNSSGLSAISSNLRLHKLPTNVFYAGGIAGLVDINQKREDFDIYELTDVNVKNIHVGSLTENSNLDANSISYTNNVIIISDFSGGLFGFVGAETYVERAEFIAGYESNSHYISAKEIAGGIVAVNFGKISQSYLSFSEGTTNELNNNIKDYVDQVADANVHINSTLFSVGFAKYVGGIAGINVGNGNNDSGTIINCYNRVDVKNTNAIGVGGIVGGAYIGHITNVYTTASLMAKLFDDSSSSIKINSKTRIGAIVGKIFENSNEGYFADYHVDNATSNSNNNLTLTNIVALNLWDSNDFDDLYAYSEYGGKIGVLYGYYENSMLDAKSFVKISTKVFVQNYALRDFTNSYISSLDDDTAFDISQIEDVSSYIELWGMSDNYIFSVLGTKSDTNSESIISPNRYRALFSGTEFGVSGLRETYFPSIYWSRTIWNYDDDILLPILEYGYESSVIRIYTAHQFVDKLSLGNSAGKLYVIMNDIDFSGFVFGSGDDENKRYVTIDTIFRGQLYGNNVTYSIDSTKFTRKPILFNIDISGSLDSYSGIFAHSTGATFSNFNIVLSNYNVEFTTSETETKASVLVADASSNTNVNNVHIYSSLTDTVNKEIFNIDHNYFNSEIASQEITVCDGYSLNSDRLISGYRKYLKLATPYSLDNRGDESFSTNDQWFYMLKEDDEEEIKFEISSFRIGETLYQTNLEELRSIFEENRKFIGLDDSINFDIIKTIKTKVCSTATVKKVRIVGLIMAYGTLPYISNSSVNVNLKTIIYQEDTSSISSIYIGKVAGEIIGQLNYVISSGNLEVITKKDEKGVGVKVNEFYVGGLVGNIQGAISICYVKNSKISIGELNNQILGDEGNAGLYIGGLFGSISKYSTVNDSIVGGASNLYMTDSTLTAHVSGTSKVGGLVGQNEYNFVNSSYIQTDKTLTDIEVYSYGDNTKLSIGGIVAVNNYSRIENIYSNANIKVVLIGCSIVNVGGVIGMSLSKINMNNVVCDANNINIDSGKIELVEEEEKVKAIINYNFKILCTENIGGLIGMSGDMDGTTTKADVILEENILSTVNITSIQAEKMYVGGMFGKVIGEVKIDKGISLGDITLLSRETFNSSFKSPLFNTNDQYIGGLVGYCNAINQTSADTVFVVLSTIRDYAIAQKANNKLNIGPVVGSNKDTTPGGNIKLYYSESVSLVSDNGYGSYFISVEQSSIYNHINTLLTSLEDFIKENNCSNLINNYLKENYKDISLKDKNKFIEGTKVNPKEFTGSFEDNKYYILGSDCKISGSIETEKKNWVLNAQGYRFYTETNEEGNNIFKGDYSIFKNITFGSAVVGLVEDVEIFSLIETAVAVIAKENNGFIFACGVGGTISGQNIASIAYLNKGVISTCFSIANINANGAGAGLVMTNGEIGNIYNCFYTGTITPESSGTFTGLCNITKGAISNCYTMADIDITSAEGAVIYPITVVDEGAKVGEGNLYKCFYDYVAYTGKDEGIDNATAEESKFINNCGIYVWTASLSGYSKDDKKITDDIVSKNIEGNWLTPGNANELKVLFKKTDEYISKNRTSEAYSDSDIKIDTSWFNYGYLTINYENIFINNIIEEGVDADDNIMRYLQLLYTGNGLANKNGQVWQKVSSPSDDYELVDAVPGITNGFKDYPYQVKHPGILDVLVNSNNNSNEVGIQYKYYLLTKNVDFIKYTNKTYWSQKWDENKVAFLGDFDGNDKTVKNMYSSYGLLRAIPQEDNVPKSYVYNTTFNSCYSKTGIVAGGMWYGVLNNIKLNDCFVYNGDLSCLQPTSSEYSLVGDVKVTFNKEATNNFASNNYSNVSFASFNNSEVITFDQSLNFAGSFVGFMAGGQISSTCSFVENATYVVANNAGNTSTNFVPVYVGGIAGYVVKGVIGGKEGDEWDISNLRVYAQNIASEERSDIYVGGIAGYLGGNSEGQFGKIEYIKINNIPIGGPVNVGGAVGLLSGYGKISNVTNNLNGELTVSNYKVKLTESKESKEIINDESEMSYTNTLAGGIVAKVNSAGATVEFSSIDYKDFSLVSKISTSQYSFVGGIVGNLENGTINKCSVTEASSVSISNDSSSNKYISGGIIGLMNGGSVVGCCNNSLTGVSSNFIAGGIVGQLTNGTVGGNDSSNANKNNGGVNISAEPADSSSAEPASSTYAGGIVGFIKCGNNDICLILNNLNTENGSIQGKTVGGIVGYVYNTGVVEDGIIYNIQINNCENSGQVGNANSIVSGGIVGFVYNTIYTEGSYNVVLEENTNRGDITANQNENCFAGGIIAIGYNVLLVSSNNQGKVLGGYITAGIAGYLDQSLLTGNFENNNTISGGVISGGIIGFAQSVTVNGLLKNNLDGLVINSISGISGGIIAVANGLTTQTPTDTIYSTENPQFENLGTIGQNEEGKKSFISGGIIGCVIQINNTNQLVTNWKNSGAVTATGATATINQLELIITSETNPEFVELKFKTGEGVTLIDDTEISAGGIVGFVQGTIDCYNMLTSGTNKILSTTYAGGIVGYAKDSLTIIITGATNEMKVTSVETAGGIISVVGNNVKLEIKIISKLEEESADTTIILNSGEVTGKNAGGIAGKMNGGTFDGPRNYGTVITNVENGNAGGLVGQMTGGQITSPEEYKQEVDGKTTIQYQTRGVIKGEDGSSHVGNAGGVVGLWQGGYIGSKVDTNWGEVTVASGENSGGIVGKQTISETTLIGIIAGSVTGKNAGGAVGLVSEGEVSADASNVKVSANSSGGGLVGKLDGENASVTGGNGALVSSGENRGGFVGYLKNGTITYIGEKTIYVEDHPDYSDIALYYNEEEGYYYQKTETGEEELFDYADELNDYVITAHLPDGTLIYKLKDSYGTIETITGEVEPPVAGKVSGSNGNAGGLAGLMENGHIYSCVGSDVSGDYAGGMVGFMKGGTIHSGAGGSASGGNAGGLVGFMTGGTILGGTGGSASGGNAAGGMIGLMNGGTIENGNGGNVSGGTYAGGIVGQLNGASITGGWGGTVSGGDFAGGAIGQLNYGTIGGGGSITAGRVTGGKKSGGIVGLARGGAISVNPYYSVEGLTGGVVGVVGSSVNGSDGEISLGVTKVKGNSIIGETLCGVVYINSDVVVSDLPENKYAIVNTNTITIGKDSQVTITASASLVNENNGILLNLVTSNESENFKGSGGIANTNAGEISNCVNNHTISGETVGGIVGQNLKGGKIYTCTNNASVSGTSKIGGIAGLNAGEINTCTVSGTISGSGSGYIGGVAGENTGKIYNINNTVDISGSGTRIGGIAGLNAYAGEINACKNSGPISLTAYTNFVGGIVGENKGNVYNSNNTHSILVYESKCPRLGGIVGKNTGGTINNCTNSAEILSDNYPVTVGGIVGWNADGGKIYNATNNGAISASNDGEATTNYSKVKITSTDLNSQNWFRLSSYKTNPGERYVGGIVGKNEGGTVYGKNNGSINNLVNYSYSDNTAKINDHRGKIAGGSTGGTVVNSAGHTSETSEQSGEYYIEPDKYVLVAMKRVYIGEVSGEGSLYYFYADYRYIYDEEKSAIESKAPQEGHESYSAGVEEYRVISDRLDFLCSWNYRVGTMTVSGGLNDSDTRGPWQFCNKQNGTVSATTFKTNAENPSVWGLNNIGINKFKTRWTHDTYSTDNYKNPAYNIAIYDIREPIYQNVNNNGLQDCGGDITNSSGVNEFQKESDAREMLYNLCGPNCGTSSPVAAPELPGSPTSSTISKPDSGTIPPLSGGGNGDEFGSPATGNEAIVEFAKRGEFRNRTLIPGTYNGHKHKGMSELKIWKNVWGWSTHHAWCAAFVYFCAYNTKVSDSDSRSLVEAGIFPKRGDYYYDKFDKYWNLRKTPVKSQVNCAAVYTFHHWDGWEVFYTGCPSSGPLKGWVYFKNGSGGTDPLSCHVGIVAQDGFCDSNGKPRSDGNYILTIEGNTSQYYVNHEEVHGSGRVILKVRKRSSIYGFAVPNYEKATPTETPETV